MTRKILVPIDINNPEKIINDFLYPKCTKNGYLLTGIKSNEPTQMGMVILTSQYNENDIFKKIIDSGTKIESVENLLKTLQKYIEVIPNFKIGNILEVDSSKKELDFQIKYSRLNSKK